MGLGWAPDLRRGGVSPLPVILALSSGKHWAQYHHAPLLHLLNSARLGLGKFFSETRLSLPLLLYPKLLQLGEGG